MDLFSHELVDSPVAKKLLEADDQGGVGSGAGVPGTRQSPFCSCPRAGFGPEENAEDLRFSRGLLVISGGFELRRSPWAVDAFGKALIKSAQARRGTHSFLY
jgi:hypothetical protein